MSYRPGGRGGRGAPLVPVSKSNPRKQKGKPKEKALLRTNIVKLE